MNITHRLCGAVVAALVALVALPLAANFSEDQVVDTRRVAVTHAAVAAPPGELPAPPGAATGPVVVPRPNQQHPGNTCERLAGEHEVNDPRPPTFTVKAEQDREHGYRTTLSLLDMRAHGCSDLARVTVEWGEDWDAPDATTRACPVDLGWRMR